MQMLSNPKFKVVTTIALFVLATILILFDFTNTPKVWVDEGVFTNVARSLSVNHSVGLQVAPNDSHPLGLLLSNGYPVIFPISWVFKIFGIGLWQARSIMVLYMFLFIVFFFMFTKKLYGYYPALLSTLLILSFSPFYGNGRPVQGEVSGLALLMLGALLMLYWERSGFQNKWYIFLSGLVLALSGSVKPLYLIIIGFSVIVTLLVWFKNIPNKKDLLYFILGALPAGIAWFMYQFSGVHSSSGIVGTYVTFTSYFASNHGSNVGFLQNITNNFLRFFTEATPILFLILLAVVSASLILRYFRNIGHKISISEFFIFLFIVVNWLGYMNGTGWYRYFFPANVLIYVFVVYAFMCVAQYVNKPKYNKFILAIPVALVIFQFYHLCFLSDTSFIAQRTRNKVLETCISSIDSSKKVLFYNTIEAIVFLRNENYSQYLKMEDFLEAGDKDSIKDKSFDYILTSNSEDVSGISSCYEKIGIDRYYLFKKIENCKNKK